MLERFKQVWSDPFRSDMDAVDVFLTIGLLIVALAIWRFLFSHLELVE